MKDAILKYIIEQFGEDTFKEQRLRHYSYCLFPEEPCSCKDLNKIDYDTQLINGGYIDSFSMVGVWHYLEQTFNVVIPDKAAIPENFNTVNKMSELVDRYSKQ